MTNFIQICSTISHSICKFFIQFLQNDQSRRVDQYFYSFIVNYHSNFIVDSHKGIFFLHAEAFQYFQTNKSCQILCLWWQHIISFILFFYLLHKAVLFGSAEWWLFSEGLRGSNDMRDWWHTEGLMRLPLRSC